MIPRAARPRFGRSGTVHTLYPILTPGSRAEAAYVPSVNLPPPAASPPASLMADARGKNQCMPMASAS